MKNQHGFFTVIGLCFLLAISICVKNIQESEKIFSVDVANFQAETELQNFAESALIEAAEKIKLQPELVPKPANYYGIRSDRQHKIFTPSKNSARLKNIKVEVYGEYGNIHSELGRESDAIISNSDREGILLFSVASADSKVDGKKIYRSRFAFFEIGLPEKIYFLNTLK